jgi:6-phosphogluconolactonase
MTSRTEVRIHQDGREWVREACDCLRSVSDEAIRSQGRVLIALSGGSTPKALYQSLASPEWRGRFEWDQMVFFFGDERCVPPDHPESNYGMTQAVMFLPLGIKPEQVHRMRGELGDPAIAAREYEQTLRNVTGCPSPAIPRLDVILLGLGDDGHTASLFPGTTAVCERTDLVAVGRAPRGIVSRLTLTLGVINQASVVLFLVAGGGKAPIVRAVLEPRSDTERNFPAALVRPEAGRLIWLIDQSAAAGLSGW